MNYFYAAFLSVTYFPTRQCVYVCVCVPVFTQAAQAFNGQSVEKLNSSSSTVSLKRVCNSFGYSR